MKKNVFCIPEVREIQTHFAHNVFGSEETVTFLVVSVEQGITGQNVFHLTRDIKPISIH